MTYANVAATLALVIAMGGTAAAAVAINSNSQIGPNTISGHTSKKGTHPNIIGGSINAYDLANTVKTSVTPHCPGKLQLGGNLCFDAAPRAAANFEAAMAACQLANLRLPSPGELAQVFDHTDAEQPEEWTSSFLISPSSAIGLSQTESRQLAFFQANLSFGNEYRCVTTPEN